MKKAVKDLRRLLNTTRTAEDALVICRAFVRAELVDEEDAKDVFCWRWFVGIRRQFDLWAPHDPNNPDYLETPSSLAVQ